MGSDDDTVQKSDMLFTCHSPIVKSGPSSFLSNFTLANTKQSDHRYRDSELLVLNGIGAWDMRSRSSAVGKERFRFIHSVSSVLEIVGLNAL